MNIRTTLRRLACLCMMVTLPTIMMAADYIIHTKSKNGLTGEQINDVKAWLLPSEGNDTIFAQLKNVHFIDANGRATPATLVDFTVPHKPATYILGAEAPGYNPIERTVVIDKVGSREFETSIADLNFFPKSKQLGEVTVTASKVKFYYKGDTVVYNADAFQLAEGSMLDGLIKQLPGVELKEGGQIYVNGKLVESLLLNGKDFFQGDNNVMLNNLGAYTVKNIEVYDKLGEMSQLAGRNLGDSQYVMDVKLKREYMSGYIGNFEAGGGTSSRYLARMFGMWYTSRSRITLVGNINNLNDSRKPGQNDTYNATAAPGDFRTKMVGLDYNVSNENKNWDFIGNTSVSHTRDLNISSTNQTNFLSAGNTYENRFADALSHELNIATKNTLNLRPQNKYISISQSLNYHKNDRMSTELSGSFNSEVSDINRALLEKAYSGEATSFDDVIINTSLWQQLLRGHTLDANGSLSFSSKVPHTPDLIGGTVTGGYKLSHYRTFDLYDINYNQLGTHSTTSSYTKGSPDHSWNLRVAPNYTYSPSSVVSMTITPYWEHTGATKDSYYYRLDRLSDSGAFGVLPTGYESSLDDGQTYFSTENSNNTGLTLNIHGMNSWKWSFQVIADVSYKWRRLDYNQIDFSQQVNHHSVDLSFKNTYFGFYHGNNFFKALYERTITPVQLNRLVNITDTRNPLNIYTGAKSLKNAADNVLTLSMDHTVRGRHYWFDYFHLRFHLFENTLVNGYSFDETTGVRTYQMFNTSGNWSGQVFNNFSKTFGTKDQFDVTANTNMNYSRSADMSSVNGAAMTESYVKNFSLAQALGFNWRIGKQKIGVNGRVDWRDTRSANDYFQSFSATTSQYGVNGQFQLPYNFGISTDLNIYTRRGYAYSEMNTTDVVWNARLSYTTKGGRWIFMLDGFDLLHQLSNITYNVNAQGRTETWNNVLPRYALFHVQYRFTVLPKKK